MSDVLDSREAGGKVVRGGALRVVGMMIGVAVSVVGFALVARQLGPVRFGRLGAVVALATIVQAVTDMGMTSLGLREWSQRPENEREHYLRVLLGLRLAMTVVGIAIAAAVGAALGYDRPMILATVVAGGGVMAGVIAVTMTVPLQAALRNGAVTSLDLARQLIGTLVLVALVLAGSHDIVAFAAALVPANLLMAFGTWWLLRGDVTLWPVFDRGAWQRLIRPVLTFAVATAVGSVYVYTAMVLTELVASGHEAGLFAASFRVWSVVAAVPAVIVTTAFPVMSRAARDDHDRLAYATQRLFEGGAVLGGGTLVACVVGAQTIMLVIGGDAYRPAAPVLRIHGVALALTFVLVVWAFALMALHRHRSLVFVNAIGLGVSAAMVLTLAPRYGAVGAAWGTLAGELVLAVGYGLSLAAVRSALRPQFARTVRVVPAVLAAVAVGVGLPVANPAATIVAVAVYGIAIIVGRALPDELVDYLPRPARIAAGRG